MTENVKYWYVVKAISGKEKKIKEPASDGKVDNNKQDKKLKTKIREPREKLPFD